jgi:S-adenosylmethionine-diacylglycerol 3-amino-3-carboxypropyl transferase
VRVRYAQCWEDPEILVKTLAITSRDDVVSIASGGDNTFALLLKGPRSLVAVDSNPAQVFLVELKKAGIAHLSYDQFIAFIGARPCPNRKEIFTVLRPFLSRAARTYWDSSPSAIQRGIIHCGKFEDYFRIFRRLILPLVHRRATVVRLLALETLEEQKAFYREVWDTGSWRRLFRIFFGKLLLGRLGRDPSYFRNVTLGRVAEVLMQRTRHGLTEVPVRNNHFLEYILTGGYSRSVLLPPYLRPENFEHLKKNIGRLRLVCSTLDDYLATLAPGSVSKFNLSDIFEYMSDGEMESSLRQVSRVSRPEARMAFWTLFAPRCIPAALDGQFVNCSQFYEGLFTKAGTFFYGSFCLWTKANPANSSLHSLCCL